MLSKAYLNHYDIGLLLAGDDDYVDLVKTVKDVSGKRIFGITFSNASARLINCLDDVDDTDYDELKKLVEET